MFRLGHDCAAEMNRITGNLSEEQSSAEPSTLDEALTKNGGARIVATHVSES